MVLWFCCCEGSGQKVRPSFSNVSEEEMVWQAFTIFMLSGLNRISHPHWVKICDDRNGQINLRAKQKYEVLSATAPLNWFISNLDTCHLKNLSLIYSVIVFLNTRLWDESCHQKGIHFNFSKCPSFKKRAFQPEIRLLPGPHWVMVSIRVP